MSAPNRGVLPTLALAAAGIGAVAGLAYIRQKHLKKAGYSKADWHRLPTDVRPTHYNLKLTPDMRTQEEGGSFTFDGVVDINLRVEKATSSVSLNSAEITISAASVSQGGKSMNGSVEYFEQNESVTITFPKALQPGEAVLHLVYTGTLNDKLKGFYRSSYKSGRDGKMKLMATTQFEPTAARRALPCWDEPAVKATFTVTLVVPKGLEAVSNMPIVSSTEKNGLMEYVYDKSPIMSTYLLAFVIGEFDKVETTTTDGVVVRVFTPVGKAHTGEFALEVAAKSLPFYANYFEIGYPLPKLDLLAIPDFAMGAMENWGCVTYRETALLHDPSSSSVMQKQYVALVVAHELAHQWFGNLVTMEWWTHLWLNEGFATWVEYLAVAELFPDWHIWTQFVSMDFGRSLNLDSLTNSHPIEVEVKHPDEIDEIFDIISYSKGSCVIRMLVSYLGEETFRKGMANYLKKYKYSNAFTEDLWRALGDASGQPVEKVMETWTKQTGFPVLHVTQKGANELALTQIRFLASKRVEAKEDPTLWAVPVKATLALSGHSGLTHVQTLLNLRDGSLTLPSPLAAYDWVKLNSEQSGHYRVLYPHSFYENLIKALLSGDDRLGEEDKLGIQDDSFALTRAGLLPIATLLEIIEAYRAERGFTVWSDLSANIGGLGNILKHTDLYEPFNEFCSEIYSDVAAFVGWEKHDNESHLVTLLRTAVLSRLGSFGHEPTRAEGLRRFDAFVDSLHNDPKEEKAKRADILAPDLRTSAYAFAVGDRGKSGYEAVLKIYHESDMHEEKSRCLRALGAAKDPELLNRTLEFSLSSAVRSQDAFIGILTVIENRHGTHLGWKFLQDRWEELVQRFGGSFQLGRMASGLTAFASFNLADEIEAFFRTRKAPAAERSISQTIEKIRGNAEWLARDYQAIRSFLERKGAFARVEAKKKK